MEVEANVTLNLTVKRDVTNASLVTFKQVNVHAASRHATSTANVPLAISVQAHVVPNGVVISSVFGGAKDVWVRKKKRLPIWMPITNADPRKIASLLVQRGYF